jgi:hypothetical protein
MLIVGSYSNDSNDRRQLKFFQIANQNWLNVPIAGPIAATLKDLKYSLGLRYVAPFIYTVKLLTGASLV